MLVFKKYERIFFIYKIGIDMSVVSRPDIVPVQLADTQY